MKLIVVSVFVAINVAFAAGVDYCSLCGDHTMCRYQGLGGACEKAGTGGVSREEKMEILDTHNKFRRRVAEGKESRGNKGPQPKAANMRKMTWDNELAAIAQRWADQCMFQHDTCRKVERFKVGQNIYWNWRMPITPLVNWTMAVESWYEEVVLFDSSTVSSYQFDSKTGHYTQVVWFKSHKIGCGRRSYGPNKLYVCNYGPAGNWIDEPMYTIGTPCSKCPSNYVCEESLCAKISSPKKSAKNQTKTAGKDTEIDFTTTALPEEEEEEEVNEMITTELPINFNIIDDLDLFENDEEIKAEIHDLRIRIHALVQKILRKRNHV